MIVKILKIDAQKLVASIEQYKFMTLTFIRLRIQFYTYHITIMRARHKNIMRHGFCRDLFIIVTLILHIIILPTKTIGYLPPPPPLITQ